MDLGNDQALMPPGIAVVGVQDGLLDASGYDANVFVEMNFFGEWETRSYMASIVANRVDKIINVPTLKDHSASGVTGCLRTVANEGHSTTWRGRTRSRIRSRIR